jgi:hypothetical protein
MAWDKLSIWAKLGRLVAARIMQKPKMSVFNVFPWVLSFNFHQWVSLIIIRELKNKLLIKIKLLISNSWVHPIPRVSYFSYRLYFL